MTQFPASYPGSIWMPVPNADVFSSNTHAAIVIHKTAGFSTPQQVAQFFISSSPGPSVHYIVGLDGSVVQCVSEVSGAGGNCCLEAGHDPFWDQFGGVNLNTVTLSIEHVDPATDNSTPCPLAQLKTSFDLVHYLASKYNIPVSNIKPHSSLDPISRARCPGNYPFSDLIAYVQTGGNPTPQPASTAPFDQEALDCWNAFLVGVLKGNPAPSTGMGIFNAWKAAWLSGHVLGPPLTYEYQSQDHAGNTLTVQEFPGARCEWRNGTATFYSTDGKVL